MKYVDRTATEYDPDGSSVQPPRPLSAFRRERAYVLLGDPGAGKTTAFRREVEAGGARYATAREFVRGDLDGALDATDAVLFIDGLDEVRAGGGDPRSPLDQIVARLRKLACFQFRLSCRPADWRLTDTNALQSLLDGGRLRLLRLDPLGGDDVRDVLAELPAAQEMDAADFVRQAVDRGLGGLLGNPQSLELLTSVVANGNWPASRTEVFEKACLRLVQEENREHLDAVWNRDASEFGAKRLLDAAGRLAAFLLLTDAQAICRSGVEKRNDDLVLDEVGDGDKEALRRALATKLFSAQSPGRFVPVHLHVAEYVGARFLRNVVEGRTSGQGAGLPSERILALLTGHNGGIVSGLRGLAAWLAALCGEARHALASADPIGVLAHGDAGGFGDDDLAGLIRALEGRDRRLLRQAWSESALGSMIRPSTIEMLRAHVADDDRSDARQAVVDMLLRGIPHAASAPWAAPERFPTTLRSFIRELLRLVRDLTWWPCVRHAGLAAALHVVEKSGKGNELVDELLAEIKEGRVHDPDNEIRGRLLTAWYPDRVPPERIWDYVPKTANRRLIGHDYAFWCEKVEKNARSADLPVLLDGLFAGSSQLLVVLHEHQIEDLVDRMLMRALNVGEEAISASRLSKWIELAVRMETPGGERRNTAERKRLRSWFGEHPAICRACLLDFLERNAQTTHLVFYAREYLCKLFADSPPSGFAAWCLDHAIGLASSYAPAARLLLEWAVSLRHAEPHFARWVACADAKLQDLPELRDRLASLAEPPDSLGDQAGTALTERDKRATAARERRRKEEQQFVAHVRERASDLAASSCKPALLDCLARTYFGFDSGNMSTDPVASLRKLLDSDERLVAATLSGFERALERDDLPDLDEIVRLDSEGKRSHFALPVLAGLAEGDRAGCGGHRKLTANGIKRAVGFYYLTPRPMVRDPHSGGYRQADVPDWYDELVRSHAELVAEGLVAVHMSKIRRKTPCEEHLASVAGNPKYRKLAQLAAPSLLRAFPVRCTRPQILALRHLLWASVRYMPDDLASRVATKLARPGMDVAQRALWLGAGMLASPGRYLAAAMEFLGKGSLVRAQHLMSFVVPDDLPSFSMEWSTEHLAAAIQGVGARVKPWRPPDDNEMNAHFMTPADDAANKARRLLSAWLDGLANKPGAKTTDALEVLAAAPELAMWRHVILEAHDRQVLLRRDHLHHIPTADEVQKVLQDGQPANPTDLLALLVARLERLATEIRDGNTNDWRQYWNVDSHGRPKKDEPRHEDICRDTLLSALRRHLPTGVGVNVDAQPEAQYAEGKRADIRVSCGGHAVPVEIKKNTHLQLWSAINDQLIEQYARAPESGGHGVYVVLWFGVRYTKTVPPSGRRPKTPEALRERLRGELAPDQRHKIKVVVVDVSRPTERGA